MGKNGKGYFPGFFLRTESGCQRQCDGSKSSLSPFTCKLVNTPSYGIR